MITKVRLADIAIEITHIHSELQDFLKDYMIPDDTCELFINCTEDDIQKERDFSEEEGFSSPYLETLAVLRKIAEIFPSHERILMHGASISYEGKGYLFTAPSGTGKTTHIRLWREYLGNKIDIINGDKPFISLENEPRIYGSPWAGKENWHKNHSFPLSGICFIERGTENRIRKMEPSEFLPLLFNQLYLPSDPLAVALTLELADKLLKKVPIWLLQCDISEDAVKCSFEMITNKKWMCR